MRRPKIWVTRVLCGGGLASALDVWSAQALQQFTQILLLDGCVGRLSGQYKSASVSGSERLCSFLVLALVLDPSSVSKGNLQWLCVRCRHVSVQPDTIGDENKKMPKLVLRVTKWLSTTPARYACDVQSRHPPASAEAVISTSERICRAGNTIFDRINAMEAFQASLEAVASGAPCPVL
jgi:hypothetical protein